MSIDLSSYNKHSNSADDKRAIAVSAALSIIHAKAGNSPDKTNTLTAEFGNLSTYADQIQEALKVK